MCSLVSFVALCIEVLVISCAVSGIVGDMSYQDHALDLARRAVADLATQYRATKLRSEANCLIYNQTTRTNSLKEGCSLFFVHIHKAGGSSVCETAVNNGYKVPPGEEENCNLPREASTNMNLTKYVEYIKENKLTFVAQENPPFRPHLPADNILYLLTIRNPLDRIISHLHHEVCENVYEKKPIRTAKNCTLDWSDMDVRQILTNKCLRKVEFSYMYNNFLMKYFSPCRGGCDSIDLAVAQSALEVFSAIVVVGEAEEVAWGGKVLKEKLGFEFDAHTHAGTSHSSNFLEEMKNYPDSSAYLQGLNSLDMQFFSYARKVALEGSGIPDIAAAFRALPPDPNYQRKSFC